MRYLSVILFIISMLPLKAQEQPVPIPVVNGVSWELATYRKNSISNINYDLELRIPALTEEPIRADQVFSFNLNNVSDHLQIDFKEDGAKIERIIVNGITRPINHYNEHIVIDKNHVKVGKNEIELSYIAGDGALNRNDNYLYTLFVPDRMRTSFPSFDQPNLKATFDLTLIMPKVWKAISSAPIKNRSDREFRSTVEFERSNVMSTYLFSFVAGGFEEIVRDVEGVEMTMLHREPEAAKVAQNVDEIFRLHKASLDYMAEYTGIDYPFKKFGFALIPSFQFGGMEHVGAIQYKARTLMLDSDPPKTDLLARAALIGHETSHMWFGDLVTMDWFNDVWTKEVFANFMSAKLVNPSFPEINHDLRSHLRLHPGAYAVDRSEGPNPIRQELPNLNEAGSMYGAIIYNKAPIMMRQLEKMLGEDNFRDGIREYLKTYAFSNATWPNLIEILDKRSEQDLKAWSEVWVNTPGRPTFKV
ncbi:MAG: peptidase M1, partial [Kordiimonadaceae bacterium]|nr:peptidase M1 [Kordiimonadaceae bacterium]